MEFIDKTASIQKIWQFERHYRHNGRQAVLFCKRILLRFLSNYFVNNLQQKTAQGGYLFC